MRPRKFDGCEGRDALVRLFGNERSGRAGEPEKFRSLANFGTPGGRPRSCAPARIGATVDFRKFGIPSRDAVIHRTSTGFAGRAEKLVG